MAIIPNQGQSQGKTPGAAFSNIIRRCIQSRSIIFMNNPVAKNITPYSFLEQYRHSGEILNDQMLNIKYLKNMFTLVLDINRLF